MSPLDSRRWERIRAVFEEAIELPPENQTAFVDHASAGDVELRAEVLALLEADAQVDADAARGGAILAGTADAYASIVLADEAEVVEAESAGAVLVSGRVLGTYRILGRLGEGAMGIVYEAEQENPRRRVALKVLRGGWFADDLRVRFFRREAQALARLKHPGIAAIHEAGSTDDGQHWLAMELVRGVPLDSDWTIAEGAAAPGRAEIRSRLALLLQVCDAVGHAHQRGVLHRDLKPSNILIVEDDGSGAADPSEPRVKILDFGLARITAEDIDASVARTEAHSLQGTLPYMSPEQVRGVAEEVDTRADLYAIGVLLYQAITGSLPHDLARMSLPRALRVICEEPPKPARSRNRSVPADLEAITLKSLEKDPARRYSSVATLGDDLRRFLAGLPVLARPPSTLYQLRKLAVRHRAAVVLGAALLVAVVLGAAGTTVGMVRARRAAAEARAEAETAAQVSRFLEDLFKVSDPGEARGNSITARELLDEGAAKIEESLRDQPAVQARLLGTIGEVYRKLGLYGEARGPMERSLALRRSALGARHPDVARSEYALGGLLRRLGEFEVARGHYERALAGREAAYGPEHQEVAVSLTGLANLLLERGEYGPARPLYERAIAIVERTAGPEDPRLAAHLFNFALLLQRTGEAERALQIYQRLLGLHERTLGPEHPEVAAVLTSLSHTYRELGDSTKARESLERALRIQERTLGPDHTDLGETWAGLGSLHLAREAWWPARRALEPAYRIMNQALGEAHPTTAMVQTNYSLALRMTGEIIEAIELGERALRTLDAALGPDHAYTATTADRLAGHHAAAGNLLRARELYERALRVRLATEGENSYTTAETFWGLAGIHERSGDPAVARAMYAQAGRMRRASPPEADPMWLRRFSEHAGRLRAAGEADSAKTLEQIVEAWKRDAAPPPQPSGSGG